MGRKSRQSGRISRGIKSTTSPSGLRFSSWSPFTPSPAQMSFFSSFPVKKAHQSTVVPPAQQAYKKKQVAKNSFAFSVQTTPASVCAKRKSRKEVMHATNRAGRSGQRAPKRSLTSNMWCK